MYKELISILMFATMVLSVQSQKKMQYFGYNFYLKSLELI